MKSSRLVSLTAALALTSLAAAQGAEPSYQARFNTSRLEGRPYNCLTLTDTKFVNTSPITICDGVRDPLNGKPDYLEIVGEEQTVHGDDDVTAQTTSGAGKTVGEVFATTRDRLIGDYVGGFNRIMQGAEGMAITRQHEPCDISAMGPDATSYHLICDTEGPYRLIVFRPYKSSIDVVLGDLPAGLLDSIASPTFVLTPPEKPEIPLEEKLVGIGE